MKYKVGDKVKIIAGNEGHDFPLGKVVKIVDVDFYDGDFPYECKKGKNYGWVSETDIEPVSEYPKEMLVSNDGNQWSKHTIMGYFPELEYPYLVEVMVSHYEGFKYAKDLPQPKELTMQEIADKFGINVEQLKIKK